MYRHKGLNDVQVVGLCIGSFPLVLKIAIIENSKITVNVARQLHQCHSKDHRPVIDNLSVASLVDKCAFLPLSDISITYLSLSTIPAIYTTLRKDYSADRKSKHPTFILASYGAEYYRHSFSTVKANTQHLF